MKTSVCYYYIVCVCEKQWSKPKLFTKHTYPFCVLCQKSNHIPVFRGRSKGDFGEACPPEIPVLRPQNGAFFRGIKASSEERKCKKTKASCKNAIFGKDLFGHIEQKNALSAERAFWGFNRNKGDGVVVFLGHVAFWLESLVKID